VGEVLAALARAKLEKNTLVIFTSDNGPECVEIDPGAYARIQQFGHRSMDGLRGVKRDAWEGGHRVPFLARWPGHIPAQRTSDEIICHVDLMATCAALVGAKVPANAGEDSCNILPALMGRKRNKPIREATILHSGNGKFAIRQADWVFIDAKSGADSREPDWFKEERGYQPNEFPGELYDLKADLIQRRNLYAEKPDVVRRLKTLLEKYKADGRSTPGARQAQSPAAKTAKAASIPDENSESKLVQAGEPASETLGTSSLK
jgi:arylsulfatase A